jgi:hypothetical protein
MFRKFSYLTLFIFFVLNSKFTFAQSELDYLGVIKLNDSSFISYSLKLVEKKGIISGYSITDIGGEHETKSNITGSYAKNTNTLSFKEVGIIYTKSDVSDYDFCYIHFNGTVRNIDAVKSINGKFNGLYNDGSTCINGEISLRSIQKIEKKALKIDNRLQKSKKITPELKEKISLTKTLDTLKMNILKSNQNLSMFTSSQSLNLQIYDAGKVDGDKINVFVNDTVLLKNYIVSKKIKQLLIPLQSKLTTVKISALNVGTISPNTAKIEITDQKNNIQTITSLKKGEKTSITIIKTE